MYTGGNAVEINTEADSTDMTECPYDDKPRTGMCFFMTLSVCKQQTTSVSASYRKQELLLATVSDVIYVYRHFPQPIRGRVFLISGQSAGQLI